MTVVEFKIREQDINQLLSEQEKDFRIEYISNMGKEGFSLRSDKYNASPIVYYSPDWEYRTDWELADHFSQVHDQYAMDYDMSILTKEYVLGNVLPMVSSRDKVDDSLLTVAFLDLVESYYVPVHTNGTETLASFRMTKSIAESLGIGISEISSVALNNLRGQVKMGAMSEILWGLPDDEPTMMVATTESGIRGAAVILLPEVMDAIRKYYGCPSITILPSSIHEVIVVSSDLSMNMDALRQIVVEINRSDVISDEDWMSDSIYQWDGIRLSIAE